jgi:hypothetical protein
MPSEAEAVRKVEGWGANGSVLVMAMTLRLKAEVEAAAAAMMAVAVVERLEGVAVEADGKAVMAELKALKEGDGVSSGKVVVGILDGEMKGEDTGVVLLEGAGAAGHLKGAGEGVADSQTEVVVVVVGWKMEGVAVVVLRTVEAAAAVLRVAEVAARDSRSKALEFWKGGE